MLSPVVDMLATYRLTRLVQKDTLPPVVKLRGLIETRAPATVQELAECPWCLSFWVGLGVASARRRYPRAWSVVGTALAASAVTGLLREIEERMEG